MKSPFAVPFAALALLGGVPIACGLQVNTLVNTTNGAITGHAAPGAPEVTEFLGIPYAKPPVGKLRFAPPERDNLQRTYNASDFSADCIFTPSRLVTDFPDATPVFDDVFLAFTGGLGRPQSEDCLSLNIWTKGANPSRRRPVLVFFYGGRFTNGDTNTPFYNGRYFSEAEDVVVVTVNYRIGIFGFPGAPGQAQNLGLRDQRMAVEWLHDNVKVFGGDPKKITILGQSSGALSVDAWTYAYRQNPIANGIIAMSGTIFSFPLNTQELSTRHWYNASSIVGCGSSGDVMACMRGKTAAELKAAAAAIPPAPGTSPARAQPIFQPTPDGEIIFDHYEQLTSLGRFARVPLLVGHTDTEQSFYNISAWSRGNFLTQEEWEQFNLDVFNCPTKRSAAGRVAYDVPTWRYRYYADWENTGIFPTSGAYHGVDLHMIFGNSQGVTGIAESAPQTLLKKTMQKAWATFAADPVDGLTALGWPRYKTGPPGDTLIQLGFGNDPQVSFIDPTVFDSQCP